MHCSHFNAANEQYRSFVDEVVTLVSDFSKLTAGADEHKHTFYKLCVWKTQVLFRNYSTQMSRLVFMTSAGFPMSPFHPDITLCVHMTVCMLEVIT